MTSQDHMFVDVGIDAPSPDDNPMPMIAAIAAPKRFGDLCWRSKNAAFRLAA